MAGDRGPRARDDRGQGIAQRGPARGEAGPVTARGYDTERRRGVLAQVAGAGAQAAQPAPHGRGRDAQLRAEPRASGSVAGPLRRRPGRSPRRRRRGAGPSRTAAACELPGRPGTGPGAAGPRRARRSAAGRPARGRGPTGPGGRRMTGTRSRPRRGPRPRTRRRRTAARGSPLLVTLRWSAPVRTGRQGQLVLHDPSPAAAPQPERPLRPGRHRERPRPSPAPVGGRAARAAQGVVARPVPQRRR